MNGETTSLTPNESLCKTHFTSERSNQHKGVPLSYTRIRGIMKEAIKAAGIHKQACVHSLRHTCATHQIEARQTIYGIKQQNGFIKTVQHFCFEPNFSSQKQAFDALEIGTLRHLVCPLLIRYFHVNVCDVK